MKFHKFPKFIALTFIALNLTACIVPSQRGDAYDRNQARKVQQVKEGIVLSIRPVKLEGTHSGVGSVAGGVLGGVAGGAVGHGYGSVAAATVGAVAGALLGSAIEQGTTSSDGIEIVVKLDNGKTFAITQEGKVNEFSNGQRIIVLEDPRTGSARVAPINYNNNYNYQNNNNNGNYYDGNYYY